MSANYTLSPQQIWENLRNTDQIRGIISKSTTAVPGLELVRQDLEDEMKVAGNLDTPLRKRFNRKKGNGKAHAYYKMVSNPGATETNVYFFGTDPSAGFFAKGGLPNSVDPQYEYISRPYSNVGDTLNVAWQDVAQDQSYIDIMAQQRKVKMINTGLMEEWAIINGSSAASGGLIFDGLLTQILNDGFNIYDLSAGAGTALRYSLISQVCFAIKRRGGRVRALAMSYTVKQAMNQLLGLYYAIRMMNNAGAATTGGMNFSSWDFGTGPVDLLDDQYVIPNATSGYEDLYFIDDMSADEQNSGNSIEMVDVDPIQYVDLMPIQTAYRGIVYETSMLQIGITQFQGLLRGINTALPVSLS